MSFREDILFTHRGLRGHQYTVIDNVESLPEKGAVHWTDQNTGWICSGEAPYFQFVLTRSGRASLKCQNWPFD
jgi:hypothetical protein